ncbi:MAG: hypothetical protein K6E91_09915 [Butyrivibrio sp.]|nr:hypothetical protein [Butyrivibrio sp.]
MWTYAEYVFVTDHEGEYEAEFIFAPSFPATDENLQFFAYSLNENKPVRINTMLEPSKPMFSSMQWRMDNRRNAKVISCSRNLKKGINSVRYRQLSPNLILDKIVLWDKNEKRRESYLGPESGYRF